MDTYVGIGLMHMTAHARRMEVIRGRVSIARSLQAILVTVSRTPFITTRDSVPAVPNAVSTLTTGGSMGSIIIRKVISTRVAGGSRALPTVAAMAI